MIDQVARVPWRAARPEIGGRGAQQAFERTQRLVDDAAERMRERADGDVEAFVTGSTGRSINTISS